MPNIQTVSKPDIQTDNLVLYKNTSISFTPMIPAVVSDPIHTSFSINPLVKNSATDKYLYYLFTQDTTFNISVGSQITLYYVAVAGGGAGGGVYNSGDNKNFSKNLVGGAGGGSGGQVLRGSITLQSNSKTTLDITVGKGGTGVIGGDGNSGSSTTISGTNISINANPGLGGQGVTSLMQDLGIAGLGGNNVSSSNTKINSGGKNGFFYGSKPDCLKGENGKVLPIIPPETVENNCGSGGGGSVGVNYLSNGGSKSTTLSDGTAYTFSSGGSGGSGTGGSGNNDLNVADINENYGSGGNGASAAFAFYNNGFKNGGVAGTDGINGCVLFYLQMPVTTPYLRYNPLDQNNLTKQHDNYNYYLFSKSGLYLIQPSNTQINYVITGGGGGGSLYATAGGGGGGGETKIDSTTINTKYILLNIKIGEGGKCGTNGTNGTNTIININGGLLSANGGGGATGYSGGNSACIGTNYVDGGQRANNTSNKGIWLKQDTSYTGSGGGNGGDGASSLLEGSSTSTNIGNVVYLKEDSTSKSLTTKSVVKLSFGGSGLPKNNVPRIPIYGSGGDGGSFNNNISATNGSDGCVLLYVLNK